MTLIQTPPQPTNEPTTVGLRFFDAQTTIRVQPRRVLAACMGIAILLALLSYGGWVFTLASDQIDLPAKGLLLKVFSRLDTNAEATIPAWYSTMLLFSAGIVALVIACAKSDLVRPVRRYWQVSALILVTMSLDEAAALHDGLNDPLRSLLGASGAFQMTWVLPALAFVVMIGIVFFDFVRRLPEEQRRWLMIGGACYFGGAIGLEMAGSLYLEWPNMIKLVEVALFHVEELLEMAGAAIILYALLTYLPEIQHE